ncbi:hypothetical protein [Haladaptatus sp. NG-SE-30]
MSFEHWRTVGRELIIVLIDALIVALAFGSAFDRHVLQQRVRQMRLSQVNRSATELTSLWNSPVQIPKNRCRWPPPQYVSEGSAGPLKTE